MSSVLGVLFSFYIIVNLTAFCFLPAFYGMITYSLREIQKQEGIKVRDLLKIPLILLLFPFFSLVFVMLIIEVILDRLSENKILDKNVISFNKGEKNDCKYRN